MNQHEQSDPLWRLMSKVSIQGECWIWQGSFSEGVPQFYAGPGKCARPARWLHEFITGDTLPRSTRIRWACGNAACVRPAHVVPVARGEAFWDHVIIDQSSGCWLWTGFIDRGGYGRGRIRSATETSTLAHRQTYSALRGDIPPGLELDHLCHVTRCVHPWHLEPVPSHVNLSRRRAERTHTNRTQLIGA